MTATIALLGVGKLGEALLSGLLRAGTPGRPACSPPSGYAERAAEVAQRYGVATPTPAEATAAQADVVLLAVKPQDMRTLLADVAPHAAAGHAGRVDGRGHHRSRSLEERPARGHRPSCAS